MIGTDNLLECGSTRVARSRGLLRDDDPIGGAVVPHRSEGKSYVVQEGDVVNVLFSV